MAGKELDDDRGYVEWPGKLAWREFVDIVLWGSKIKLQEYVWRGQRNVNWSLQPSLNRLAKDKGIIDERDKRSELSLHVFRAFKRATRGIKTTLSASDSPAGPWWALARQYGLRTPLLDWSYSPFVAAFFAYAESSSENDSNGRAVYALHRESLSKEEKSDTVFRLEDVPLDEPRMLNQRGLYTVHYTEMNLVAWVRATPQLHGRAVVIRFILKDQDRLEGLKALNKMNINHRTLFPDLDGAAQYCNMAAEIEGYSPEWNS